MFIRLPKNRETEEKIRRRKRRLIERKKKGRRLNCANNRNTQASIMRGTSD